VLAIQLPEQGVVVMVESPGQPQLPVQLTHTTGKLLQVNTFQIEPEHETVESGYKGLNALNLMVARIDEIR